MIWSGFDYATPRSIDEAVSLVGSRDDAAILAGGLSLLTAVRGRQRAPALLVDLRQIPGLVGIEHRDGHGGLRVMALTTLNAIARDQRIRDHYSALAEAAAGVGDPQVRNRGTLGGNLVAGELGNDLPAAVIALDATFEIAGKNGTRSAPAAAFYTGPRPGLDTGEILQALVLPPPQGTAASAYEKFPHPATSYAICGVAASVAVGSDGAIRHSQFGLTGAVAQPMALPHLADALIGRRLTPRDVEVSIGAIGADIPFVSDLAASAEYRAHLVTILVGRACRRCADLLGVG